VVGVFQVEIRDAAGAVDMRPIGSRHYRIGGAVCRPNGEHYDYWPASMATKSLNICIRCWTILKGVRLIIYQEQ